MYNNIISNFLVRLQKLLTFYVAFSSPYLYLILFYFQELELPLNLWEEEPLVASAAEGEEKYDRMTDFLPASREEDECLDELEMNVRGEKKHLLEVRIRGGGIVKDENGRTWRRHQLYGSPTGSADGGKGGRHSICRVYVGNLSWSVSWQDLKDHMRSAGNVVHANVISEDDGRSKGFGIVEYCSPEEAREAISTLTDTHLKGRLIFVREDRVPSKGSPGGFQAHYLDHCSVYVGNLSYETSWQVLKDHMRKGGSKLAHSCLSTNFILCQ